MNLMIERAFIVALLLSISGFVFCAIFLPFEKIAYKWTSARTMVYINTIALFSFVTPLYFVVSLRDGSEKTFIQSDLLIHQDISRYDGFIYNVREQIHREYLGTIWLIGVIGFFVYYVWKYASLLYAVKKSMFYVQDDLWHETFCKIKDSNQVSNVSLIGCCNISTPCTIGIRKRYIVIPAYMIAFFDEEEIGFILEHEFYHVKHRDLLRKLLVLFLNCLNWFNPLYYLLMKNLSEWTEAACDEDVTKKYTKGQKRKYCELIIKVLELEQARSKGTFFSIGFVGLEIKNYKWRMIKIMKKCSMNSRLGKVTVATIAMVAMFCGNASAKELDVPVNMLFSKNVEFVKAGELEEVAADDIQMEGEFESHTHINKDSLVEFELCNTKVKVEKGRLIYDDSSSEAEYFLLNGRYYFKLADIEKATNKAWGSIIVSHQVVGMAINNGYVFEKFPRIDITWNDSEKIINVNIIQEDIQKIGSNFLKKTTERDGYEGESYNFDADFICIQQGSDYIYITNEADINLVLDELSDLLNQGEIVESPGKNVLRPTANFMYRIVWVTNEEIKDFAIYKDDRVYQHMSDTEGNDIAVSKTELDVFLKIVDKLFENAGDTYHQDSYDT